MSLAEWIHTYQAHLPPHLRPNGEDPRFTRAAQTAQRNGWRAKQTADTVTAHNYNGKHNPVLIAIMRLEEISTTPPGDWIGTTAPTFDYETRGAPLPACPWHNCRCTHTHCYDGWIDQDDGPTRPCPQCRPELHHKLGRTPPPGRRTTADLAYLRERDRS